MISLFGSLKGSFGLHWGSRWRLSLQEPNFINLVVGTSVAAFEAWRATLPERQRRRLVHPLSNVRRWRVHDIRRQDEHHEHPEAHLLAARWVD
jgi:hypothetical protein